MSALYDELKSLEGLMSQNPETGALNEKSTYLGEYTNRLFGAPFQFMDSVDKRFSEINEELGNEYLRNIMLNSPVLHIRPGMPYYTGGDKSLVGRLKDHILKVYVGAASGNMSTVESLLSELASTTIFGVGSKLQRRMFGFRETYYDYMSHVNYMCRSVATMLNLTTDQDELPWGTYVSTSHGINDRMESFATIKWQNYRMLKNSYVKDPAEYLLSMLGDVGSTAMNGITNAAGKVVEMFGAITGLDRVGAVSGLLTNGMTGDFASEGMEGITGGSFISSVTDMLYGAFSERNLVSSLTNKVSAVEFMVEPGSFTETLTNDTEQSQIAAAVDAIGESIGSEIGFITNSNADTGVLGELTQFLGDASETVATSFAGIVEGVTGGFMTNLFTGAIQSIKGQKMIYPEIYKRSTSNMNYTFTINLSSPYGDAYNYFMNIVVPLLHIIALTSPRLVTANTTASPYLVQAYIPGQCTCHLGIVQQAVIMKNPNQKRVSVNGFPLEVKVELTIKELYNAMAISPANDPASFLFNETLNDYMANMAGLIPSVDTFTKQRAVAFQNLALYFESGEFVNDMLSGVIEKLEDTINPFVGR